MGRVRAIFLCAMMVLCGAAAANAEPARLALLIGNQNYADKVGPLKNPHSDVALIGAALTRLGFTVTVVREASYRDMAATLKRHVAELRKAGPGAIGFFYYSGHGVANPDTGINYLVPADIADVNDPNLWSNAFEQSDVIEKLSRQAPQATHYVVFDACRNELRLSSAGQKALGAEKGFVPAAQAAGLLIAYSTGLKQTASDAGEGGGPYARALAAELVKPGVKAVTMFRNVQLKVKQAIGQDPWLSFPSLPEVYLAGRGAETAKLRPQAPLAADAQAWSVVQNTASKAVLEEFISRFPDSVYGGFARARVEELKKESQDPNLARPTPTMQAREKPEFGAGWNPFERKPAEGHVINAAPWPVSPTQDAADGVCDGVFVSVALLTEKPCIKPGSGESFWDCLNCPEMVVVPSGSFMMGSPEREPARETNESPQHRVTIAKPFAVGRFAITRGQFENFVKGTGYEADGGCYVWSGGEWEYDKTASWRSPGFEQDDDQPVVCMNWNDAGAYAAWLAKTTGQAYRLLSEAEFEYAARAGTRTPFWWGKSISTSQANYGGNYTYGGGAKGEFRQKTLPVKSFQPNPWGIYQVHGNALMQTQDCWHESYDGAPSDGSAWITGDCTFRTRRGGDWHSPPNALRAASRSLSNLAVRNSVDGFRLARTLD